MKGIFIIDAPDYVKPILDLIKKFASQKISERVSEMAKEIRERISKEIRERVS
jgi:CRAL/TRIO domain.